MIKVQTESGLMWYSLAIRGLAVGILSSVTVTFFANTVAFLTDMNKQCPFLIILLPLGALICAQLYRILGEDYRRITVIAIDQIHDKEDGKPQSEKTINPAMGIIAYLAAFISHLLGASVGKEGVGVQIGLSTARLTECIEERLIKKDVLPSDYYLMCGASAAFGTLFSSPIAGVLFGMQFASPGKTRLDAALPCLASAYSSVFLSRMMGIHVMHIPPFTEPAFTLESAAAAIAIAVAIGLFAHLFLHLLEKTKKAARGRIIYVLAAFAVIVSLLMFIIEGSFSYNGLSADMLYRAIESDVPLYSLLVKALLVILCLSSGFQGGEVVPLLVIGACFGNAAGSILGMNQGYLAAIGALGMLSAGTKLPLVCFALGLELFGFTEARLLFLAVMVSYMASGKEGIYQHQRVLLQNA